MHFPVQLTGMETAERSANDRSKRDIDCAAWRRPVEQARRGCQKRWMKPQTLAEANQSGQRVRFGRVGGRQRASTAQLSPERRN